MMRKLRPPAKPYAGRHGASGLRDIGQSSRRNLATTVAAALASAGLPLAIVNPRQIRSFAKALGKLAKTDAIDAEVIALFADKIRPQVRPVATSDARALGELVARRRQVVEMIGMEANRRRSAMDKRLVRTIDRHVAFLEKELNAIDADIDTDIRASSPERLCHRSLDLARRRG